MSKRVVIWGTGREAKAAADFIGDDILFVDDTSDGPSEIDGHPVVRGNFATLLDHADLIVKSPGVSLYDPRLKGKNVTSLLNLWFENKPDTLTTVCISGTKGKSTTSTLLHHVLKKLGKKAVLAGNIGNPLSLDDYRADIAVIEVSSYQAANFTGQADIAIVTNLYEEHLDWHKSKEQYFADKLNLLKHARVKLIGHQALDVSGFEGADAIPAATMLPQNKYLTRPHNAANVAAVLAILNELGIGALEALPAMQDYQGLPHRQYELGERDGVLYVDDSIATTPQSTEAALEVYQDHDVTLIAGGFDRGIDYAPLVEAVKTHKVTSVICLGASGKRIAELLTSAGISQVHMAANMAEAVAHAKTHTQTGGVVLLSPAAPSFGLFTDYQERGKAFAREAGF